MTIETTDNAIRYDWCLTGPDKGIFTLYPMKGKDNRESILEAKKELRQQHDVVYIHVTWITVEQAKTLDSWLGPKPELDLEIKQLA